jgi:hypothetical protein
MRSQCRFFMSPEDEAEFIAYASIACSLSVSGEGRIAELSCSLGTIQFLRSQRFGSTLTLGRIALVTTASGLEGIYRQLRRWLQKHYTNDLVTYNESFPPDSRKTVRCPSIWLAPHARIWLLSHSDAVLRQSLADHGVYTLSPSDSAGSA